VAVTCRVLGFSTQAFYKWRKDPVSRRDWDDAHLINAALDIHHDDPAFGYRLVADELPARGITAGENRVARLCSQQQIWSAFAKRRGLRRKAGPPVHDDLVQRQFTAQAPDQLWLTDITEHPTAEGKLYLCAIKDACSGRITGYSMDSRMKASLAVAALRNAIALRSPAGRGQSPPRESTEAGAVPNEPELRTAGNCIRQRVRKILRRRSCPPTRMTPR
jgi:transposase InsO family protein